MPTFNFTYPIPDEIWVENWSQGLTGTLVYEGPAEVDLYFGEIGQLVATSFDLPEELDEYPDVTPAGQTGWTKMTINAGDSDKMAVAAWFAKRHSESQTMTEAEHPEEVREHITSDGKDWLKLTNPRPDHLFEMQMQLSDTDGETPEIVFKHILKHPETFQEFEAKKRKSKVKFYADQYDLGTEAEAAAISYMEACDAYITSVVDDQPWHYVDVDLSSVPKIPVSIMTAISTIVSTGDAELWPGLNVLDYHPETPFWE